IDKSQKNFYNIPSLSPTSGISSLPIEVLNSAGDFAPELLGLSEAIYKLKLNFSEKFNVRFRFRLEENVLNTNKEAIIFSCNGVVIKATVVPLRQMETTYIDNETQVQTTYWPVFLGGIRFTGQPNNYYAEQNIGGFAFTVQY